MITNTIDDYPQLFKLQKYIRGHKGYIAGGCFKYLFEGKTPKDIDIFFENHEDYLTAVLEFKNKDAYKKIYENKNAMGFLDTSNNMKIDLVKSRYAEPEEMLVSFDFTITKFALMTVEEKGILGETNYVTQVLYHEKYFEHLVLKRLVIDNELLFPLSSFERSYKYATYGYKLCKVSKEKMVTAIQGVNNIDFSNDFYAGFD